MEVELRKEHLWHLHYDSTPHVDMILRNKKTLGLILGSTNSNKWL